MEQKSGRNAKNLRAENRGLLFRYLMTGRGSSRAELAQISGLTKMTVTNIISEFLADGLIKESGDGGKARRNNPITLELSADAPKIIAVLIHRTHLSVALCSFTLEILAQESVRITSCDRQTLVDTLLRLTDHMMAYGNILGIGIGSIGPVDIHNGVILNPPDFYGIRDLPVAELFRAHYGLPVFLDYHYNCAALAEKYYGYGKSYSDYLYLGVTDGLSLGIICNNQLFSSFTGYASEIGHLCVNFDDTVPDAGFPGAEGCLGKYVDFGRGPEEARLHRLREARQAVARPRERGRGDLQRRARPGGRTLLGGGRLGGGAAAPREYARAQERASVGESDPGICEGTERQRGRGGRLPGLARQRPDRDAGRQTPLRRQRYVHRHDRAGLTGDEGTGREAG